MASDVVKNTSGVLQYAFYFRYDQNGAPIGFGYKSSSSAAIVEYYYLKNLQGDITGIVNTSGNRIATYVYNAWGEVLSATGTNTANTTIAERNPLRYRGYVYDTESSLYYLQSRYYSPAIGRFISADSYAMTYETPVGANMFAYALNNPVSMADNGGEAPCIIAIGVVLGAAFGALDAYMSGENVIAGALIGGLSGGITSAIPTMISAKIASKATSKAAKIIAKNAMPMVHAAFEAVSDYTSQVTQSKLKKESLSWDVESTINAAVVGFSSAKTTNRINKLTGKLLTSDKAAEAVYEYFSGLFYGTINLIKSHGGSK